MEFLRNEARGLAACGSEAPNPVEANAADNREGLNETLQAKEQQMQQMDMAAARSQAARHSWVKSKRSREDSGGGDSAAGRSDPAE